MTFMKRLTCFTQKNSNPRIKYKSLTTAHKKRMKDKKEKKGKKGPDLSLSLYVTAPL